MAEMLPYMLDEAGGSRSSMMLLDSSSDGLKLNSYCVVESGERLQLLLVDESRIEDKISEDDLLISERSIYETS